MSINKISTKIWAGFIAILLIMTFIVGFSYVRLKTLDNKTVEFRDRRLNNLMATQELSLNTALQAAYTRAYLLTGNETNVNKLNAATKIVKEKLAFLDKHAQNREKLKQVQDALAKYEPHPMKTIEIYKTKGQKAAIEYVNTVAEKDNSNAISVLTSYVGYQESTARSDIADILDIENMILIVSIILLIAALVIGGVIAFIISRLISRPIREVTDAANKIALGEVNINLETKSRDEIGQMVKAFKNIIENTRRSASAMEMISEGDLSVEITPRCENDVLSKGMKKVVETLRGLIYEMDNMSKQHEFGDIDVFVYEGKFNGAYKSLAKGVNDMVKDHIETNKKIMACVDQFGKGNFNAELEKFPGKKAFINKNIEALRANLKDVHFEINKLISAANQGNLNERANSSPFHGDWASLINGLNGLVEVILAPLNESMKVLEKMSVNDYTMEMTGEYKGKLKEFSDSINLVRTRLFTIQDALEDVGRGNTGKLEDFEKVGRRTENDKMLPAIITAMRTIQELINEVGILVDSAVNGNLNVRGNEDKFKGGYREIIAGMNKTLEAVVKPIQEASAIMEEMAKGNLTVSMKGVYRGEYSKIEDSLNSTIKSFHDVLNDISNAAVQVAAGSRQVSNSAQALSQGSTEQASSIEELTASMEEIAAQTKQSAINANDANKLAITAKEDAVRGNVQMQEMLKAMIEINDSSASISKIIKVIDEIAFQTNILALNAAVEAARAGQHGKGFAVVAEEVRNLAARSANAAKETTTLIEGSIKKAEVGTKIANETAEALNTIVEVVARAAELVGGITSASNEQATGISQVNQGIMQVSEVTQTNSATSQESAAASEELSSQAEVLREMVSRFRLRRKSASNIDMEDDKSDAASTAEAMLVKKKSPDTIKTFAANSRKIDLSSADFGKY